MGIKFGSSNIDKLMLGSTEVNKVYLGTNVVYESVRQLLPPTNLIVIDNKVLFDEPENATSYEIYADGVLIGEDTGTSLPTGETWIINEHCVLLEKSFTSYSIYGLSNGKIFSSIYYSKWAEEGPVSGMGEHYLGYGDIGQVATGDKVIPITSEPIQTWTDQLYRIVTFTTSPTGELLTWLQSNAIKR